MNDKLLEQMASRLGTTVEHLWGVLIKQAPLAAMEHLIWVGILLISFIILVILSLVLKKLEFGAEIRIWIGLGAFVCIVATFIQGFLSLHDYLTATYNPEYWAFEQMTKLIINKVN